MHKLVQLTPVLTINTALIVSINKNSDNTYYLVYINGNSWTISETQYKSLF